MKLYTFRIPEDTAEGRLLPLVRRMLPQLSARTVQQAFDRRDVKQNGKRMDRQAMLQPGAEVKLYAPDDAEAGPSIPVLFEDENILVIHKPAGISCQKDAKGGRSIAEVLHMQRPDQPEPLLCHRLDNQTEGILLLAKTREAQAAMEEGFFHRRIHKRYVCLAKGCPSPESAVLHAFLLKDDQKALVRVSRRETPGSLPIITEYHVAERLGDLSRLEIDLHTGRTHQIRAHMAFIGHPILGDDKYGDRDFNRQHKCRSLMLCAAGLRFEMQGKWKYLNALQLETHPKW